MKIFHLDTSRSVDSTVTGMECFAVEPVNVGETLDICPTCKRSIGPLRWQSPFRVELVVYGKSYGDIVDASGRDWLISDRLRELIDTHRISGLEGFEPVEIARIVSKNRIAQSLGDPPQYFRVSPQLGSAAIDQIASEFVREPPEFCQSCRLGSGIIKRWKRIVFEPSTWTGEDVFIARGLPGSCFTSERFRDMCLTNNVTNAVFTIADKYWHDFYPWENQERAREVLAMPNGPTIRDKHTLDGDFVRYIESRNECVIRRKDGTVELFYPFEGPDYFEGIA